LYVADKNDIKQLLLTINAVNDFIATIYGHIGDYEPVIGEAILMNHPNV
jgi:hypothetical protein